MLTPSLTERAAIEMFASEPPAAEVARDAVDDYEAASDAADKAEVDYEAAWEDIR